MLKVWVDSGAHHSLAGRNATSLEDELIEVVKIQAFDLAAQGQTCDPYVIVLDGEKQIFRTPYATAVKNAEWKGFRPTDRGVDQPRAFRDGQPLFFEVWDADYGQDAFIGGFVIYPRAQDAKPGRAGDRLAEYTTNIRWDWKEPQPVSRSGYARVWVRFTERSTASRGPGKGAEK
jgi:hypothetical protein